MDVPRPASGYWERLRLGQVVEQVPLPEGQTGVAIEFFLRPKGTLSEEELPPLPEAPRAEEVETATEGGEPPGATDVTPDAGSGEQSENAAGVALQLAKQTANVQPIGKRLDPGRVELPPENVELHPIAERHMQALQKAKPDELGFVSIRGPDLFVCDMTPALVPRFGRAMHALVCELEHRGYSFEEGEDNRESLRIVRDGNQVEVGWSEGKVDLERMPTDVDKRRPSWTWTLKETKSLFEKWRRNFR